MTSFRKEMFQVFTDAMSAADWPALAAAGFQSPADVVTPIRHYEGRTYKDGKNPAKSYAEIYMRSAIGLQASLANHDGVRRWEDAGTLWIMCFGSDTKGEGLEISELIATIASEAYQGVSTENCAWFRNVRKINVGSSGGWYHINVLVDYEYDEVR
ncbi:hypothetical protein GUH47_28885 [Xanthomonas citri pv. citri]|nr:hypothetical protein [Xanthomonas citri pv. citri]